MAWLDPSTLTNVGIAAPQSVSSSSSGWYDPSKWSTSNPIAGVNPLTGMKVYTGYEGMGYYNGQPISATNLGQDKEGNPNAPQSPYTLSSNGTKIPLTQNPDGTYSFSDKYDDPSGSSNRDQMGVTYTLDPKTGIATPTSAASFYQPGEWVTNGQPVAAMIAAMGAAALGGGALAGAGGGGTGAAAGAAGAGGGMTSADLAALYGAEGYGATGAGAGLGVTGTGAAGTVLGTGAGESVGAGVGAELGAGAAGGSTGMTSADLAALYGNGGYGASSAAEAGYAGLGGTTAGGASPGFWSSLASGNYGQALGSAGDAVGNYLSSPSGIQSLAGLAASYYSANKQSDAANRAAQMSMDQYNQTRADNTPYRLQGYSALGQIANLMGTGGKPDDPNHGLLTHQFGAGDLNANLAPNWKFQLDQGIGATTNAANASGFSGNALKGINDYAQNYAGNAYQQAYNNYTNNQTNIYNRLSNLAGLGQVSNQITANSGTANTANAANYLTSGAAAQAAGMVGGANAINNGINNYQGWNYLNGRPWSSGGP